MKVFCWNINGIRSLLASIGDLQTLFERWDADVVCFQETRINADTLPREAQHVPGYQSFWSFCGTKKGYSGVATYCRESTGVVAAHTHVEEDREGRILLLDLGHFVLFNCYFPNGGSDGQRLDYKDGFFSLVLRLAGPYLQQGRPMAIVGDVNVAYLPLDISNPILDDTLNCFRPVERKMMHRLLEAGFVDCYRWKYPEGTDRTWYDPAVPVRTPRSGWRIDYALLTPQLHQGHFVDTRMFPEQLGSDHCPLVLELSPFPPLATTPPLHPLSSLRVLRSQRSIASFFIPQSKPTDPALLPASASAPSVVMHPSSSSSPFSSSSSSSSSSQSSSSIKIIPKRVKPNQTMTSNHSKRKRAH